MRETKITCDTCSADLTSTGNCEDFRLCVSVEAISSRGGAVTLMAMHRPIKQDAHFCGLGCLAKWPLLKDIVR